MAQFIVSLLIAGCAFLSDSGEGVECPEIEPMRPPDWLFYNVNRYNPLIERWQPEFPDLPPGVVRAVMAAESKGINNLESYAGAVGLMQVIPRSWTGTRSQLMDPAYNIFMGMKILSSALHSADGDMIMALALYNCGEKVWNYKDNPMVCGSKGGRFYADSVLHYYCPWFAGDPSECADFIDLGSHEKSIYSAQQRQRRDVFEAKFLLDCFKPYRRNFCIE